MSASREPAEPRTIVVGTAGHIDHGKSELIAALTGTHPDRLREERERGITIDIGFANLATPGVVLSFVDVPGHERFIKNMLAGASGIDLVLLVVASDESIRPQTREHFHICELLGLQGGVIALTKTDLADPDLVELARAEIHDFVRGSFLAAAPIVPVSARTGQGVDQLKDALAAAARELRPRPSGSQARLPIDRSFTVRGFGTVVTGTLVAGSIAAGDDLEMLTARRRVKVRGLEVHGASVKTARAGQRVALNLQGLSHDEIARGDILAAPGAFTPTSMFDAEVSVLADAPAPLEDLSRVRLHAGTAEILARVRPLGAAQILPGESGFAQFRLERPAVVVFGDRFIFRRYSPAATLGGGRVLDIVPSKRRRSDTEGAAALSRLSGSDLAARTETFIAWAGDAGAAPASLAGRSGAAWPELWDALGPAVAGGRVHALGGGPGAPEVLLSAAGLDALEARTRAKLAAFHKRNPLLPGYPLEQLRQDLESTGLAAADAVVEFLARSGHIRVGGGVAALPTHQVRLGGDDSKLAGRLLDVFLKAGLNPPTAEEAYLEIGAPPGAGDNLLAHHIRQGVLRRLRDGRIFHIEALEELRRKLKAFRQRSEVIDIAAFKELAGVSRKNAIPLLEHFDEQRVTLRRGNDRVILE